MSKELEKQYNPKNVEERLYKTWLDKKYFHAKREAGKKTYTIVIPPPNITGQLHMGHALDNTLQDILIRYHRMAGYDTLWLPGTDHASIATEAKIVETMRKEGVTKEDLGREKFLERAWDWKAQYGGRIIEQLKKMGSSCDWDRERFTLDEGCNIVEAHGNGSLGFLRILITHIECAGLRAVDVIIVQSLFGEIGVTIDHAVGGNKQ